MGESMIGSYTGRMAPPGRPKMTSTPSISRDLIRAAPPLVFMVWSSGRSGKWVSGAGLVGTAGSAPQAKTQSTSRRREVEDAHAAEEAGVR